jgi:hypothetical protein
VNRRDFITLLSGAALVPDSKGLHPCDKNFSTLST